MKTIAILVSTALLGGMALAQMPDMTPPKEMEKLHPLVGTWKGKEKHFDPASPEPMAADSTITNTLVLGGHFLKGDYKTTVPGFGEFTGMQMLSYDPATKKYMVWWFDAASNTAMKGESSSTGPEFVYVSEPVEMPGMGKTKMRITTNVKSATMFTMKIEMETGGQWVKFLEGEYTKQ
ncbi:MAG: DUF1579 domain-containing protein [Armatimonadota bacterium]|nr:DUF1579 domain-containing protein [Armatimonadota bacterium]